MGSCACVCAGSRLEKQKKKDRKMKSKQIVIVEKKASLRIELHEELSKAYPNDYVTSCGDADAGLRTISGMYARDEAPDVMIVGLQEDDSGYADMLTDLKAGPAATDERFLAKVVLTSPALPDDTSRLSSHGTLLIPFETRDLLSMISVVLGMNDRIEKTGQV